MPVTGTDVTGTDAVDAINGVFGRHPGYRAAHARGTVCRGVFTPSSAAAALTSAAHMQSAVEVTARFSNASGDPGCADADRDARGMAVKLHHPDAGDLDIVAVTLPCFFVRTREDFMKLNRALRRNSKGQTSKLMRPRLGWFVLRHREAGRAAFASAFAKPVPSYANRRYNALHAFKWSGDGDVHPHYVRYSWRPQAGEKSISRFDARKRERDYLQRDLYERLGREPAQPIRFTLELQLASIDDLEEGRICDPTAAWPGKRENERKKKEPIVTAGTGDERERFVDAGELVLNGLDLPKTDEVLVFDPMNLTAGIEAPRLPDTVRPSSDEILEFRPEAYGVSVERRTTAECAPS